ncbi:type I-C CRISPR-associated protein Cas8c/Csd1 [Rhodomicrobium sp. Az07]|uniref:type I-C CRISPR-associated protein Cas8c/Csd1 n=1 Tax=Rhodomicrobium sp. Az07 TaxID=2839034 RepID=UPI001BEB9319|nr:type I-C CRISPR-associated protein Cas8c/Csd1 [Rhodomicrobium sp. Az07]MBT3070301.1 type I-C CRISPR-associated protein Cas8c/Csd1 [Rhodomicrobium sp. Az07]
MSILASLAKAYQRLPDAPPFGFSSEKIGFLISLNEDGTVACPPVDLRQNDKKRTPRQMFVPQAIKRTSGVAANFLWDKTAYVLGVTAAEGKSPTREHAAFVERHLRDLESATDAGLKALIIFLKTWSPRRFDEFGWPEEMKDQNVVFCLEADRRANIWLHDRPAAKALWSRLSSEGNKPEAVCLISGVRAPVARLHPAIKNVWGAQSSGASIVSFNLDAFSSYGHEQGDNAPVSETATFAYTTALNRFLEKDSGHRIQIGDASVVFWADASDANKAAAAENIFAGFWDDSDEPLGVDEGTQAKIVGARLKQIRNGEPLRDVAPELAEGVRFYILALAPNAARLSIRFYFEDDFGAIAANYQRFLADLRIEPPPRDGYPALWKYLAETAVLKKRENVPPNLAGEWMRAILGGTRYPQTLLATVLMRLRADKDVNAQRVAILKALLIRNNNRKDTPVALTPDYPSKGYQLGRLFAVYERIQADALGGKVNATITDKFYGSASAQPRKVFGLLASNSKHHLSKLGKQSPGRRVQLEKLLSEIQEQMSPDNDPFPVAFSAEDQALFGLGYYHQRNEFFKSTKNGTPVEETAQ